MSILYEIEPEDDSVWAGQNNKDVKEHQARLNRNTWILEHLHTWVDFDYYATVNLLVDSLKHLGQGLIRWDNALHAKRNGVRAIYAAHQIDRAYNFEMFEDVSYKSHSKRSGITTKKLNKVYVELVRNYLKDNAMSMDREEYDTKMFKVINKRLKKKEKDMQLASWLYLNKYLTSMWD